MCNLAELGSWMSDNNLYKPTSDDWASIKYALSVFIDCWYGSAASFMVTGHTLQATWGGSPILELAFNDDPSERYPLYVDYMDAPDDEYKDDHFNWYLLD